MLGWLNASLLKQGMSFQLHCTCNPNENYVKVDCNYLVLVTKSKCSILKKKFFKFWLTIHSFVWFVIELGSGGSDVGM